MRVREKGTEGLGGGKQATWLYTLPGMAGNGWQHPSMEVRISELPVFKAIGLEARPALILVQMQCAAAGGHRCRRVPDLPAPAAGQLTSGNDASGSLA